MKIKTLLLIFVSSLLLLSCSEQSSQPDVAAQNTVSEPSTPIASNVISGTVSSSAGTEAGIWVIAETGEFDTFFARIVVTNEQGRYLIPNLPEAEYQVWTRGYGLADSPKLNGRPGTEIDLQAVTAADDAVAAQVYPAAYWYSMMGLPSEDELENVAGGLNAYLTWMKNMGCVGCHQLGQESTRTISPALGDFETHEEAWMRRVLSGQAGQGMFNQLAGRLDGVPFKYLGDWTQRIADGELPHAKPDRPAGIERNVVVTVRDWSNPQAYMHDLSGTDRRDPTVNGNVPLYGAPELSTDEFPVLDPVNNTSWVINAPVRDADTPTTASTPPSALSPYWGDQVIWDSKANAHNPMLDQAGRVWYTARIRGPDNPDFCKAGSAHPSAQLFPTERAGRQLSMYDPETEEYTFIDTCYSTHHLQFAYDQNNTLWTSGGGNVVGWLDTEEFLRTGDAAAAQGWSPLILDTNGNGQVDEWNEPGEAEDPEKDTRVRAGFYAVMPNPADGSIWGSNAFAYPGSIVRFDPETGLGEKYNVPLPGFASRGADIDKNGVIWVSLGSGHLGEFDRSKCTGPLNGPTATGDHCPEGWTFHQLPGPGFRDLPDDSVESSYYTWVDQHNSLGLGEDVPIVTGNLFDGVHALVDGEFQTLRVPYPMGFYTKGFEGRIDDVDGGWAGRGIWVPSGDRTPWLKEGGQGTKPLVVHFQVRPDPLTP
ncbi:MAG: carboxypeptidase regulatory-like domain-containing protein [Pseudomonadales bacterium]|nr:carboxypeptidase regulatory-like domain-containing protein [Pseudomonadales bacterium]